MVYTILSAKRAIVPYATTLLSAARYAPTVVLYLVRRTLLPDNGKLDLGVWEIPN